ncbi:MAG: prephenate dehydrogenase/arogenate dehydrogenase family protein [Planctomycetota bacterium]
MGNSFETVAVVGVGLIGGSIGLALRERKLATNIIGIGRRKSSLNAALKAGCITQASLDMAEVAAADLIVVCTPAGMTARIVREVAAANPKAIITDAASTKQQIVGELDDEVGKGLRFVGSHPLAGNHLAGPTAATADLYDGRQVIVTPTSATDESVTADVCEFWQSLGANVTKMTAEAHDAGLATTSHLPHVVASVLAAATDEEYLKLVASGWCDTTRVAAGSVELWHDILAENRGNVLNALDNFGKVLDEFRSALAEGDMETVTRLLDQGKQHRDTVGN